MRRARNQFAERAAHRKAARRAGRPASMTQVERLMKIIDILQERLNFALQAMEDQKAYAELPVPIEFMDRQREWVEALLDVEPPARSGGRVRKFDFWRSGQRHTFTQNRMRTMLRRQMQVDIHGYEDEPTAGKD